MSTTIVPPQEIPRIYQYYLDKTQYVVDKYNAPQILKTDSYNEAVGLPRPGGIVKNVVTTGTFKQLEINEQTVNKALYRFPELSIVKGDIRNLPFDSQEFDIVLDLSTLDHIPPHDIENTICEYCRVLSSYGTLLLVVWLTNQVKTVEDIKVYDPDNQYYFPEELIRKNLTRYQRFTIQEEETIFMDKQNGNYLQMFLCHK